MYESAFEIMNSPIQVSLIRFESTMQEHSYFYGSRAIT
jgi:hypothetical protein